MGAVERRFYGIASGMVATCADRAALSLGSCARLVIFVGRVEIPDLRRGPPGRSGSPLPCSRCLHRRGIISLAGAAGRMVDSDRKRGIETVLDPDACSSDGGSAPIAPRLPYKRTSPVLRPASLSLLTEPVRARRENSRSTAGIRNPSRTATPLVREGLVSHRADHVLLDPRRHLPLHREF